MNPNAKTWTPNASAQAWTPKAPPSTSTITPPKPPNESENVKAQSDANTKDEENDDVEEEIDENDPLWIATLKIAQGDRKKALKMLEDTDALMKYPEIRKILESGDGTNEDDDDEWDKAVITSLADNTSDNLIIDNPHEKKTDDVIDNSSSAAMDDSFPVGDGQDVVLAEGDPRENLNIVFIGHVDAGKSTLSGSILYLMGMVDKRTIERFEREAKERNRESWFLAFIMDTSEEERAKGKTVEVGRAHFETAQTRYTILDAPGHKNYVPNMISGAAQADVGVLVISARKGEFETGFEKGGQTREHALLAKTLGVQHLIVVINKMDDPTVNWDMGRYEECVTKLKPYLKQVGYVIKKDVKFVPISALGGDNVLNEVTSDKCAWWTKYYQSGAHNTTTPTLISTLDSLLLTNRNPDGPLRIPCLDRYFETGCVVLGKVESGTVRLDDELTIAPTRKKAKVKEIVIGDLKVKSAKPGENVLIKFQINVEDIQKGYVLCHPQSICPAISEIKVQLLLVDMLEHRPIFSPGYDAVMHVHTVEIEITCVELISVTDIKLNKQMKRPFARQGQQCIARLVMPLLTCMETFDKMPSMGRLTIRDEGKTIAIGKILEVISK
eukprot:gene14713-19777_t